MTYDRRTASDKSLHSFLKKAEAEFLKDVARAVNGSRKIRASVTGVSTPFINFEGEDYSDIHFDGYASIITTGTNVLVTFEMNHAYRGRIQEEYRLKTGELTTKRLADIIIKNILGSR